MQIMYMHHLTSIVSKIPGLRLAINSWMNKEQRDAESSVPQVGLYYRDRHIGRVDQGFMDEVPHWEDWRTGAEKPRIDRPYRYMEAYHRNAWPDVMRVIENKLPQAQRQVLRKAGRKLGFVWWRN